MMRVSLRERATTAMAAVEGRNPNLDDFVGLNWSCWVDRVNIFTSDAGLCAEYESVISETMTLSKEDKHIFGECPSHDDFYLVVCSHCGLVVKPQAFEKHCERRHDLVLKMCGQSSTLAPQQRPRPGRSVNLSLSRERQKDSRCLEASITTAESPGHHNRPTKARKEGVSLSSVENPHLPHNAAATRRTYVSQFQPSVLPSGLCSSSSSTSPSKRPPMPTSKHISESPTHLRGKESSRICTKAHKQKCDLKKQSSEMDQAKQKPPCKLICNAEGILQQQRSQVLAKQSEACRNMEPLPDEPKEQHLEALNKKITNLKNSRSSNCHILSRSRTASQSFPEEEADGTVKVEVQTPYPFNQHLLSGEESDDDEQEEATDLPATSWHPKPLGLCTFGCRSLACNIFTFDRRLHHLRFALTAMLEHHVSTHRWKKIPQASSGLRSHHVTESAKNVSGRSHTAGTLSLACASLGQLEKKSRSTKLPSNTSAKRPARLRNPIGLPGSNLSQNELSCSSEETASRCSTDKRQPQVTSSQGPVNGHLSHGKKTCHPLPLQPSKRPVSALVRQSALLSPDKAATPHVKHKISGSNQRPLGKKRKSCSESQPLKCQRLSSLNCPISWKGESIGEVQSRSPEKRPASQIEKKTS
ncbi:ataxin-7-like protein 2 isoform X1 [Entelurus aequoreus]|uniref:ataxin-7-like protein 2 isoform X1 n=1 Tax=Entelurus aequoreus TaxID=161455 RepID=UPI002B1E4224|nr:ataxin-7-like protein 2 isoform X1 [Entelurus aequoreus]